MFHGKLIGIAVASRGGEAMRQVDQIDAVEGKGLVGDRYAELKGAFQRGWIEPKQQVTLIEAESIAAAADDYNLPITHAATRRNLLTDGVPLNHLVNREFWVGPVRLRGVKLCEPCKYLEKLAGAGWIDALRHRGGLRAEILTSGTLTRGDLIRPVEAGEALSRSS